MADEPRRSVRATKGQHTKTSELLDAPSPAPAGTKKPTKKSKKKAAKKDEEEEEEIIRCVCGATETGDDDNDPWIACDQCDCWQHNICVGISRFGDEAPDKYLCEIHDPTFPLHKELLDGLKKGRKVWEERRRKVEQEIAEEEAEKQGQKKKGKKAQAGKRASDISEISHATNGKSSSPSVPATQQKGATARSSSTKRKARDDSHDHVSKEPQAKIRKVAEPQPKSPPSDLPAKIDLLEQSRATIAKALLKNLKPAIVIAIRNGIYALSENDTVDAKAERLAVELENAVYITNPKDAITKQARSIAFNLKQNQELTNGLLNRTLAPTALAVMTTDDMASKELKAETAEMKARADKQSIMVTEDGPRIRRTHKGDELVEEDDHVIPDDSTSVHRRRSMLDPNADMGARSRENSPGDDQVELPDITNDLRSHDDIRGNVIPKFPLTVETKQPQAPVRKSSTQTDFDINRVFSSVQHSPVSAQHIRRPSSNIAPPANGPGVDPEIDKLLQDDDGNESPPYSPTEYSSDPEIVWRGSVTMDSVAKFPASAKHTGGADLTGKMPWESVLPKDLRVAGRIDHEKANEYLCSLRYAHTIDVVVVAILPTDEVASRGFQELYNYFSSKNRYGVLTNKTSTANIRDTYLVPIPPSPGKIPDFVINLEGHKVPEDRPDPMLLVTLVIRSDIQPEHNNEVQSPSVMTHPQRQMSISGAGPAMSPIAPPTGPYASPVAQPAQQGQLSQAQIEEERRSKQREGEATAVRILGPHVNAPTVAFLLPQAFQMRTLEWELIADILEKDQKARHDLAHLSQLLEARVTQRDRDGQASQGRA